MKGYCSSDCARTAQYNERIRLWKAGELDGKRGKTSTAQWIRRYIFEKYDSKCAECKWDKINPTTGLRPLELEHIDGDYTNNKEENLSLLCPSCHSLTPTYKGGNKKQGRPRAKYYRGT